MERLGPFELERPLGEGGSAMVFVGRRSGTDERVAVKVMRGGESDRGRFRREIQILRSVRHPAIVELVDQGIDQGTPWYAMKLLDGGTLDELCRPPGGAERAPLAVVLRLFSGVCKALAHLHGRGIVHCDVKPSNIFLRDLHRSVLGDFGLVSRFGARGRETLQVEPYVIGSSAYMAPEQFCGDFLDARCDLYALGCSLFEAVSGRLPFFGSDDELMMQHVNEPPPRLRDQVSVPAELDELVDGLLQKDRRDRIGFADDVRRVLDQLSECEDDDPPAITSYLFRPDLVGRRQTVDVVVEQVMDIQAGRGTMTLVRGESGVGKTRLAMEIGQEATQDHDDVRLITAECVDVLAQGSGEERLSGGPLHPFRPVLQAVVDDYHNEPESNHRWLGPDIAVLAPFEPSLASIPHARRTPEELPPSGARLRIINAMIDVMEVLASRGPLVLIIDDLQWADDLSLAVLDRLARSRMRDMPLCVVGTLRSEDLTSALQALWDREQIVTVPLDRLEEECVRDLVGGMLGLSEPPPPLVSFVAQVSEGNPFFAAEYLRVAVEQGLLVRTADGAWQARDGADGDAYTAMALPRSLAELVERRIESLQPATRDVLERATVLGREFDVGVLELAAGPDDLASAIEELISRQILEEVGVDRLRFAHDKLREIPYDAIAPARRRGHHRSVAEALEAHLNDNDADLALFGRLGLHWSQAGIPHHAARCFHRAADHALANYANGTALGLYRSALREAQRVTPQPKPLLLALRERLGDTFTREGKHHEAQQSYEQVTDSLPSEGTRTANVLRKTAKNREFLMKYLAALETLQSAERALGRRDELQEDAWHLLIWILLDQIWVHYWNNDLEGMGRAIERVDPLIDARGTVAYRARLYIGKALYGYRADRYVMSPETVEISRKGLVAAEQTGDINVMTEARYVLGLALLFSDQVSDACEQLYAAVELAHKGGLVQYHQLSLSYLSLAHRRLRHIDETTSYVDMLREEDEGLLGVWSALGLANLAWVALHQGRDADAARYVQGALTGWASMSIPYPFLWTALLVRLQLQLRDGEPGWVKTAEELMGPELHRLPDDMVESLEAAVLAASQGDPAAEQHAWDALERAQAHRYV